MREKSVILSGLTALSLAACQRNNIDSPRVRPTVDQVADQIGTYPAEVVANAYGLNQTIPLSELSIALMSERIIQEPILFPNFPEGFKAEENVLVTSFYSFGTDRDVEFSIHAYSTPRVGERWKVMYAVCYGCVDNEHRGDDAQEEFERSYSVPVLLKGQKVGGYEPSADVSAETIAGYPDDSLVHSMLWWTDENTMHQIRANRLDDMLFTAESLGVTVDLQK